MNFPEIKLTEIKFTEIKYTEMKLNKPQLWVAHGTLPQRNFNKEVFQKPRKMNNLLL